MGIEFTMGKNLLFGIAVENTRWNALYIFLILLNITSYTLCLSNKTSSIDLLPSLDIFWVFYP